MTITAKNSDTTTKWQMYVFEYFYVYQHLMMYMWIFVTLVTVFFVCVSIFIVFWTRQPPILQPNQTAQACEWGHHSWLDLVTFSQVELWQTSKNHLHTDTHTLLTSIYHPSRTKPSLITSPFLRFLYSATGIVGVVLKYWREIFPQVQTVKSIKCHTPLWPTYTHR